MADEKCQDAGATCEKSRGPVRHHYDCTRITGRPGHKRPGYRHLAADFHFRIFRGEVTEWLRGTPGKRVRLNGPAGSSPALSAILFLCGFIFKFIRFQSCCARRGGSGALLPAIRYSRVELPTEAMSLWCCPRHVVMRTGSRATEAHEPRQIRKEAAVSDPFRVLRASLV